MTKKLAFLVWVLIFYLFGQPFDGIIGELEFIGIVVFIGLFFLINSVEEINSNIFGHAEITRIADELHDLNKKFFKRKKSDSDGS